MSYTEEYRPFVNRINTCFDPEPLKYHFIQMNSSYMALFCPHNDQSKHFTDPNHIQSSKLLYIAHLPASGFYHLHTLVQ